MNHFEFYSNLQTYQENDILHGVGDYVKSVKAKTATGESDFKPTYYQKVENAFGPGKHRYFYTKDKWDAYQRELAGYRQKADQYVNNRNANNNSGANRAAKDSAVANAQNYKKQQEQAVKRKTSMQNIQSSRESAMKQGQQSTMQQIKEERQRRAKFLESQQAARDVKQKIGQDAIRQEQNKLREYNKNAQAAQNAEYNRGNKESAAGRMKTRESQSEAVAKRNEAAQKMTSGRDAAISSAKQRDYEANTNRTRAKDIYTKQGKGDIVDKLIKESKANSGITAEELAEKCNVNPAQAQVMLYETTGIMVPSKSDVKKKG